MSKLPGLTNSRLGAPAPCHPARPSRGGGVAQKGIGCGLVLESWMKGMTWHDLACHHLKATQRRVYPWNGGPFNLRHHAIFKIAVGFFKFEAVWGIMRVIAMKIPTTLKVKICEATVLKITILSYIIYYLWPKHTRKPSTTGKPCNHRRVTFGFHTTCAPEILAKVEAGRRSMEIFPMLSERGVFPNKEELFGIVGSLIFRNLHKK